jgi:aspartyl-tRNA synthetase
MSNYEKSDMKFAIPFRPRLLDTLSIRNVIAFRKTANDAYLMVDSPAAVEPKQLRDFHLELKVAKRE